jgi:hypothetical protein
MPAPWPLNSVCELSAGAIDLGDRPLCPALLPAGPAVRGDPVRGAGRVLLRKEVIQPHLPIRLPCYDFTPITSPTFDGCPPRGLAHRLRVLPALVV